VAEAVTAVMAQQPIRLLCERCKKEMAPAAAEEQKLRLRGETAPSTLYRGVGCIDCQAGYGGKRVLFEALAMTHAVRCILLHADRIPDEFSLETAAVQDGMMLMRRQALDLLQNGSTTVDEVLPFIL
jgi:type IV pilus assembly protein PilB